VPEINFNPGIGQEVEKEESKNEMDKLDPYE